MATSLSAIKEIKNEDLWVEQIIFWRTHLDVFLEDYFKLKLHDTQKVIARNIGNASDLYIVKSRGYGKTWLITACAIGLCVLYPDTEVAIISGIVKQANLCMKKINRNFSKNPDIMREIRITARNGQPARVTQNGGECYFKNGSSIQSYAIGGMRGERTKIVIIDEAPLVKEEDVNKVAGPTKNYKRDICHTAGIQDYPSKTISITSACFKSSYFFEAFVRALKKRAAGDTSYYGCALDYKSALRSGANDDPMFFQKEKERLSQPEFDTEYNSIFLGEEANAIFPYSLVEPCRGLTSVETEMPKGSKCKYVISLDIATSMEKQADNAIITVIKLIELDNGNYLKRVVLIRSYHGTKLDGLAEEIRRLYVKFPNTIKVVFDQRGIGDSFPQFLNKPWIDAETGKEYPPWYVEGEKNIIHDAEPMLWSVKADLELNKKMVSALRVALEQKTLDIPISARLVYIESDNRPVPDDSESEEEPEKEKEEKTDRKYTRQEYAVFLEADALQFELGCLIAKQSEAGHILYTTAMTNQHKDRYSSLAMGVYYISDLETARKAVLFRGRNKCLGIISRM